MKFLKVTQIILLCLIVVVSSIGLLGCGDDNSQIRKVITKFYDQDAITEYSEGHNSNLVMPSYYCDVDYMIFSLETYYGTMDASKIEIRFKEISITEDYATAKYDLFITDKGGEEHSWTYYTRMVNDGGRWKLSYTRAKELFED